MEHLRMSSNFWIGLRRNPGGPWQWENGTFYTVTMSDDNENRNCAYFHGEISALDCSTPRVFICVKN
ncbi:hypothetical protein XELAEV_18028298mg [Xenopus laevis]|nr:hypothetical protein XELAEV_18028298mg [Xenopus laevis]